MSKKYDKNHGFHIGLKNNYFIENPFYDLLSAIHKKYKAGEFEKIYKGYGLRFIFEGRGLLSFSRKIIHSNISISNNHTSFRGNKDLFNIVTEGEKYIKKITIDITKSFLKFPIDRYIKFIGSNNGHGELSWL